VADGEPTLSVPLPGTMLTVSPWVWLGLGGLAVLGLYARLLPALVREWIEFPSLSHGFAVPAIAAYLLWSRRDRIMATTPRPSGWGLPILILGLTTFVVGVRGDESFIARISLPIALLGLTMCLAGPNVTRTMSVGIGYLTFMIPLPYETLKLVTYRDRLFDAAASADALGWLGVPVYRDGVLLHLPDMTLEVADACSSIPAVAALMTLGVAYAAVVDRPRVIRALLVVATLPFAIAANIIRITTTAAGVYYLGPWTLRTAYHQFNGTVNFLLTLALLLLFDRVLHSYWPGSRR
jgi:exosortase